jgi:hypothetical protein
MENNSSETCNFLFISVDPLSDTILKNIIELSYEENISLTGRAYLSYRRETDKLFRGQSEDITQLNYLYFQLSRVISENILEFDIRELIVNIPIYINNSSSQRIAGLDPFTAIKKIITVLKRLEEQRVLNIVTINLYIILPGNLDSYFQSIGGDKPDEANEYLIQFRSMLYDLNIYEIVFQTRGGVPLEILSLSIKKENDHFVPVIFPFKGKTLGRAINKTYILGTAGTGRHAGETADFMSQKLFQDFAFQSLRHNKYLGYIHNLPMNFQIPKKEKENNIEIKDLDIAEELRIKLNFLSQKEINILFSKNKLIENFGSISTFAICSIQKPNQYIYRYLKLRETKNFLSSCILSEQIIKGSEPLLNIIIAEKVRKVIQSLGFTSEYSVSNNFVDIIITNNIIRKFIEGCFFYQPDRKLKEGEIKLLSINTYYLKNWLERDPFDDNLLESRENLENAFEEFITKLLGEESIQETIREWVKTNFEDFLENLQIAITRMINEMGPDEFGGAHTASEADFILYQVHQTILRLFFPPPDESTSSEQTTQYDYQNLLNMFKAYSSEQNKHYQSALDNIQDRFEPRSRLFRNLTKFEYFRNLYRINLLQGFPFQSRLLEKLAEVISIVMQEYLLIQRQKYEYHWNNILDYSTNIRNRNNQIIVNDNQEEIGQPGQFYKNLDESENDLIEKHYLDSLMELQGCFLEKSLTFSFQLSRFLSYCPSIYTAVETEIALLEERRNYPNQVKSIFKKLSSTEKNEKFLEKVYENHFYKKRRNELHNLQETILSYWKDKITKSFQREKTHMKDIFMKIEDEMSKFIIEDSKKLDGDIYFQLKELRYLPEEELRVLGEEINFILDSQIQKVVDIRFKPEPDQHSFFKFQYVFDSYDPNLESGEFRVDWKHLEMGSHHYPLDSPLHQPFKAGFLNTYIIREIHRIPLNVIKKKRTIDQNIKYPQELFKEIEESKKKKKSESTFENSNIDYNKVDSDSTSIDSLQQNEILNSDGNLREALINNSPDSKDNENSFSQILGINTEHNLSEKSEGQSFSEMFETENKDYNDLKSDNQNNESNQEEITNSFSDILGIKPNENNETENESKDPFLENMKHGEKFDLPDF